MLGIYHSTKTGLQSVRLESSKLRAHPRLRVRGRPSDGWIFVNLIYDLSVAYERATGRRGGASTIRDQHGSERVDGPFVRFVRKVLAIIEPDRQRRALGSSIHKALRRFYDPRRGTVEKKARR